MSCVQRLSGFNTEDIRNGEDSDSGSSKKIIQSKLRAYLTLYLFKTIVRLFEFLSRSTIHEKIFRNLAIKLSSFATNLKSVHVPPKVLSSKQTERKNTLITEEKKTTGKMFCFSTDVLGIMCGPSSSHTGGAAKIALLVNELLGGVPESAVIHFYNSFCTTGYGHRSDVAVLGGLCGIQADDLQLAHGKTIAKKHGIKEEFVLLKDESENENTIKITARKGEKLASVTGLSIGGGNIEITHQKVILLADKEAA